jgi:5-aminopentanamidase
MRVACCQLAPEVGHPEHNLARARAAIAGAVQSGARIVLLPELVNSGYVFESAAEVHDAAVSAEALVASGLGEEAARGDAVVIAGFCELAPDGRVFNSSVLFDGDGVLAVYRKLHLWDRESEWFVPGEEAAPVVDTRHGRIGLAICYDVEFPEVARGLALEGAELIALPTNWPRDPGLAPDGRPILHSLAAVTAYCNRVFVAVCDRCGTERGLEFEGGSVIVEPPGGMLAGPVADRGEQMLLADCDLSRAQDKRTGSRNDAFADRRPDRYGASLLYSEAKLGAP